MGVCMYMFCCMYIMCRCIWIHRCSDICTYMCAHLYIGRLNIFCDCIVLCRYHWYQIALSELNWLFHFIYVFDEGSGPEWYISSMVYSQDTPFWFGTLGMYAYIILRRCVPGATTGEHGRGGNLLWGWPRDGVRWLCHHGSQLQVAARLCHLCQQPRHLLWPCCGWQWRWLSVNQNVLDIYLVLWW